MSERRSPCPVACTLDLIGDRWTLLVVRDLLCGKTRFRDFSASPEGIASNILAQRLSRLVLADLVEKRGEEYHLTAKGRSLGPVLEAVARWGLEHLEGTRAWLQPRLDPESQAQGP